ncbi:inorganic phosphate transporter [Streptomyces sp. TR1341]|uniref:Phosphate transporter n=1 Tax=Streptomyces murinus TaxID=33900 RepID=A0A7W3RN53_STRMR|nr:MULTISPECIES: inorganic phosphate transporter [Streptomyces]NDK26544.1 inorganic phosphate transporter [Streptomyces sp. TR1341]MBA9055905.1 PiT family inorganic phosphate transporter [Streptomyces murinus]UWW90437.1 inorganic phosphate transporter [Streptomyces murinus]WSI87652.1 inorganic phosphate transporter [Streptomyces murinus]WUD09285.1 inorganic phosphate transporter [Streptomyces murinus]
MDHITLLVAVVIVTALAFDFTNGFHDTANAMATSIATGALRPRIAVLISGVLNIAGAFLSTEVARTISGGIVDDALVTPAMIFAGLVGAILWNLATWLAGLPSSSSHALFGGLIGAVWVGAGSKGVHFDQVLDKVLLPAVVSPVVAGVAACAATYLAYLLSARARQDRVTKGFRLGQVASASLVSLAHGTNDAQKTMGVITLTLISAGALGHDAGPPVWVIGSAGLAIGLGTYLGGWRIIRTMGKGLTDIQSPQGFAAETASTAVILTSAHLGFALSTTQVASGSILGAGLGRRLAEVRWGVAGRMALAWLITLPFAALVGGLAASVVKHGGNIGTVVVALVALALALGVVVISRRNPVHADNVNDHHEVTLRSQTPTDIGSAV